MLAALTLAALVLAAGISGSSGRRGAVALGVLSVLWVLVNEPMEGPVLIELTATHGVRSADLAALVGLVLAGYRGRASWGAGRQAMT